MKKLLSLLGTTAILTSAGCQIQSFSQNENQTTADLVRTNDYQVYKDSLVNLFSKKISDSNESQIKIAIEKSLKFSEKDELSVDLKVIEKSVDDSEIINFIKSPYFLQVVKEMYSNGLISRIGDDLHFTIKQKITSGQWIEFRWYWFGSARVHWSHDLCQGRIQNMLLSADGVNFMGLFAGTLPELTTIAPAMLVVFDNHSSNTWMISSDVGNGVMFGTNWLTVYNFRANK